MPLCSVRAGADVEEVAEGPSQLYREHEGGAAGERSSEEGSLV